MKWMSIVGRVRWILWGNAFAMFIGYLYALTDNFNAAGTYLLLTILPAVAGGGLHLHLPRPENLRIREGTLLLVLGYLFTMFWAAQPFYWLAHEPFPAALYEATSGLTTTGSTTFLHPEDLPRHLQFWRSWLQFFGGLTVVLLYLMIPSIAGVAGLQMNRTDSFGAQLHSLRPSRWLPQMPQIILQIVLGYLALHGVSILWFRVAGMHWHDAICHSFGVWATSGFTNYDDGWEAFYQAGLQWGAILFMTIGGLNLIFVVRLKGNHWRNVQRETEFMWYLGTLGIFTLIVGAVLQFSGLYPEIEGALRSSLFHVVSFITNTGLRADFVEAWPDQAQVMLFLALFIGACTGSTASGMRMQQQVVMWKYLYSLSKRVLQPLAVIPIRVNGQRVEEEVFLNILGLFLVNMLFTLFGGLLLTDLPGIDFFGSWQVTLAALWNVSVAFGSAEDPALAAILPMWAQLFLTFTMLLGRLEVFVLLVLFTPAFWKR